MTFDPIKTVEALNVEIARMHDCAKGQYGLTPCEAYHLHTLTTVRDAIVVGIGESEEHYLEVRDLRAHEP